eukprot:c17331_g1_i1.p1 GENE.c17331_g1_i1~~c17331_g1_i1.p1  ORF type:complete len:481 (+),score=81.28 c17331_g1_i1:36-1478(+)
MKQGLLWKRPRGHTFKGRIQHNKWQLRWFHFHDGQLEYFAQTRSFSFGAKRRPSLVLKGTVLVQRGVTVELLEGDRPFAFVVHNVINVETNEKESLLLACSDGIEMMEWMSVLASAPLQPLVRLSEGNPVVFSHPNLRSVSSINELYHVEGRLGQGSFSVVKKGIDLGDGREFALKLIPNDVYQSTKDRVTAECKVLASLDHPGIVKLKEVVSTEKFFVLVMELLQGEELFHRLVERKKYREHDAKVIAARILDAIRYMHKHDIVHRDIKPENIIFDKPGDDAQLKLVDFGFAEIFNKDRGLQDACGSLEYAAPEILEEKEYDTLVDMWSAGVVIYILLCGFPPFYGASQHQLIERICAAKYTFTRPYWDPVSENAKDLVTHLLEKDPRQRYSAQEALQHRWFADIVGDPFESSIDPNSQSDASLDSALALLKSYNAFRKLKKGVLAVMAINRMQQAAVIALEQLGQPLSEAAQQQQEEK